MQEHSQEGIKNLYSSLSTEDGAKLDSNHDSNEQLIGTNVNQNYKSRESISI